MTIILTFKVAQGLILAADSRLTITEQGKTIYISDTQEKLFVLGKDAAVLTCGTGFLGGRAVSMWIKEFNQITAHYSSIKELAEKLLNFLPAADSLSTTFLISGFDAQAKTGFDGVIYKLNIFANGNKHLFDLSESVSFWDGEFEAITRLLLGRAPAYTNIELDQQANVMMRIPYYAMTLQDGLEFARFLVNLQIQYQRFSDDAQSCGGAIDLAVIRPENGFQWINQKIF